MQDTILLLVRQNQARRRESGDSSARTIAFFDQRFALVICDVRDTGRSLDEWARSDAAHFLVAA